MLPNWKLLLYDIYIKFLNLILYEIHAMLYIIEAIIGRVVVLLLSNLEMHSKIAIKNYVE
jgi:hypothetical protein